MKARIASIAAVTLLLGGAAGFAASSSPLIGAKVEGVFTVQKADGTKIGDAVIINGTAYAPVRAISETTGTELSVEGKKIIMKGGMNVTPAVSEVKQTERGEIEAHKAEVEAELAKAAAQITDLEKNVIPPLEAAAKELANKGTLGKDVRALADEYQTQLADRKKELVFFQTELSRIKTLLGES
ncbi:hypothetical protein C2I18_00405 [Paenibacillus sp. PK3_47]|uniref:hypothetical protein n=1 Tax=Paenibacillus sp. PK3_47 TaxID=2072642 RepID=UPI00201E33DF|nr:hypothetical protein [Paenibacillus sp. PK3_47]UQZ32145.1 hypothetical protein C2I18_00405 [Paenibacillus sp. PK3_47]